MKTNLALLMLVCFSALIHVSYAQTGQPQNGQPSGGLPPPSNPNPPQQPSPNQQAAQQAANPCDAQRCRVCDMTDGLCASCRKDYYLNYAGFCDERDDYEDRGDGYSVAVAVLNIIFLFIMHHAWIFISRKNQSSYLNLNLANHSQQLSAQNLNRLQNNGNRNNNNNNNNNEDYSPELIKVGAPSEFDTRSKKSSVVAPQYDDKNNVFGNYNVNNNNNNNNNNNVNNNRNIINAVQMPAYEIESNAHSPDYTNGFAMQNGANNFQSQPQMMGIPQGQNQQQQQQSGDKQYVTSDLNGFWMTQAGKFSFKFFSNLHRIKHVTLNIIILERIFSSMFYWAGRRGDDNDNDERKQLLFLAFFLCIILYWLFTFIPPIFLKIFSYFCCLQKDPNGRCSSIFIGICFYVSAVIMTVVTTSVVVRMSGFEAQVWILLCLAAYLIVVFFDKKSVEWAKRRRGGCMEGIVKFRKIDFSTPEQNQPNNI